MTPTRTIVLAGGLAAAGLLAGLAFYGTRSGPGNLGTPSPGGQTRAEDAAGNPCAGAAGTQARLAPLARGEVAALDVGAAPRPAPNLRFKGRGGGDVTLAAFRGRALLVNLWATWCTPCRAEMPALDRLQAELGSGADPGGSEAGARFAVLALNVETRNLDRVPAWLADNGIAHLTPYTDPAGRVLPEVQAATRSPGLPTSLLVDAAGCTVGVMMGPAQWDGPDGRRVIRALVGDPS